MFVLSHPHTDHVGGIASFLGADVVVSETEWRRASGLRGKLNGYLPQYRPREVEPTLVRLDGPAVGPFASSLDLAGDGSILLVPLPGHTPGQIGVLARHADCGVLIAGDAAHTVSEFVVAEPDVARFCRSERIPLLLAHDEDVAQVVELPTADVAALAGRS